MLSMFTWGRDGGSLTVESGSGSVADAVGSDMLAYRRRFFASRRSVSALVSV